MIALLSTLHWRWSVSMTATMTNETPLASPMVLYYMVVWEGGSAYDIEWQKRVVPMPSYCLHQPPRPTPSVSPAV